MDKWTYPMSAQQLSNEGIEQLQILKTPQKPLYHYTSREVFWLIMESETFLARHIMFSNDYEENMIGKQKVSQAMADAGMPLSEPDALPFMVCFCEESDLLSQWRGYAKEGVALEFDFSKGLYDINKGFSPYYCYTIMNADIEKKEAKEKYISKNLAGDEELFMGAIVSPYSVIYTESGETVDKDIREIIDKIKNGDVENKQQYASGIIPYIKNNKFDEEREYRLIFDMKQYASGQNQHLLQKKYVYLDVDGIKKPNIRVRFGNMAKAEIEEVIDVYYANDSWTKMLTNLQDELSLAGIKIELIKDDVLYPMEMNEVILSSGKNQEQVCIRLRTLLARPELKVWCDGHLPVRRVIVGPSKDSGLMKCSIEEYLKTKYWAKDIEVKISDIPLRT